MNVVGRAMARVGGSISNWFFADVDPRVYALLRYTVAVSAAAIWIELWPLRHELFSSAGMFGPTTKASGRLNWFAWGETPAAVDTAFVVALICMSCLLAGVFTRLAAVGVYVWAVSYSAQTPIALAGYDTVLRLTTFALAVSPAVGVYSLRKTWFAGTRALVPRYGLRILQWQLMLVYWCTVWLKAPDAYWRHGNVISYFWMSNFARFPTPAAAHLGALDAVLTWSTLLIEAALPVLLWQRRTRMLGLALGFCFHVGIALSAKLALFSLSMLPMYVAFLEKHDLDRLSKTAGVWVHGRGFWQVMRGRTRSTDAPEPSSLAPKP